LIEGINWNLQGRPPHPTSLRSATFPSRGRQGPRLPRSPKAFPLRGRWQQGGKSIGFAGLPIGQTATAKSEILTPHHPLMLTDEVIF
jgi:hypothetical protein